MLSVTTAVYIFFKLMIFSVFFLFWIFIFFCNVRTGKSYLWYIKIPPEISYKLFFCVLLCSLLWSVLFYFYFLVKIKKNYNKKKRKQTQAAKRLTAVRLQRGHKATKKTTNACKVGNWNFAGDNVINMLISSRCFYLKCHN